MHCATYRDSIAKKGGGLNDVKQALRVRIDVVVIIIINYHYLSTKRALPVSDVPTAAGRFSSPWVQMPMMLLIDKPIARHHRVHQIPRVADCSDLARPRLVVVVMASAMVQD